MALKIKVLKAPEKTGECGGAKSQVKWVLDAADTGYVIQQVDWNHEVLKCDDTADPELTGAKDCNKRDTPQFWEAWRVENGKVFVGRGTSEHGSDTFNMPNHASRKNKHSITGKVQFISGYTLTVGTGADDWKEGDIPAAGALPTRKTAPTGFDASTARDHKLSAKWNCCATPPEGTVVEGDPKDSDPGSGEREKRVVPYEVSPPARRVATQLLAAPSWLDLELGGKAQAKLMERLRSVSANPPDVIRGGVEYLIEEAKRRKKYTLDEQSKLFLLNRYLFKLPRAVEYGKMPFFGGWLLPESGARYDPSWPFGMQKGSLVLKAAFSGYMGDEFLALAEFDYFRRHFERRKPVKR